MSGYAFVELPAFGHVNPSLPLVRELVARGERVVYYNDAGFRSYVEAAGGTFRAYPPGVVTSEEIAQATQTGDLLRVPRLMLGATDVLVPFLLDNLPAEQPAAVVLDANALWGHIAARTLQLPTIALMTTILLGSREYRSLRVREWGHLLRPMLASVAPVVAARSRLLRRFGKSVVPEPAFPALGALNLALFPKEFQPANRRVNATFRFVGPLIDQVTRAERAPFPAGSEPLVYMSLGTLHRAPIEFLRACLAEFAEMQARFVISIGPFEPQVLGPVPANCQVCASVPQLAVLQQASAFITHGGMNSVLEALSHCVPMLVIPQHVEQLTIGGIVADHGAALVRREHVADRRLDAAAVRDDLQRILATPQFRDRAGDLQTLLAATGACRQAADEVQGFVAA